MCRCPRLSLPLFLSLFGFCIVSNHINAAKAVKISRFSPKRMVSPVRSSDPTSKVRKPKLWTPGKREDVTVRTRLWISYSLVNCVFSLTYPSEDYYSIKTAFFKKHQCVLQQWRAAVFVPWHVNMSLCLFGPVLFAQLKAEQDHISTVSHVTSSHLHCTSLTRANHVHSTFSTFAWEWGHRVLSWGLIQGDKICEVHSVLRIKTKQQMHVADQKGFATCLQI